MSGDPSLYSLCVKTVIEMITNGYDHLQDVLELPPDLLDNLVMTLPPLALQTLHEMLNDGCIGGYRTDNAIHGKKRGRYEYFNMGWNKLFDKRWPDAKKIEPIRYMTTDESAEVCNSVNCTADWQQLYWEKHLQECLDGAAETALLPGFYGHIGEVTISDSVIYSIDSPRSMIDECMKLSYHCNRFGCYARCLRLQNVLCSGETCELLKESKLQKLTFVRIKSKNQVDGVCMLLNHHRETLWSLEFIHCLLYPTIMNQICNSMSKEESVIHGIRCFSIKSSPISESKSSSISSGLLSLLSSGGSLASLCFYDTRMQPKFAKMIFDTLLGSSCGLVTLEISDNNLIGWLSQIEEKSTNISSLLGSEMSMKSLKVLNLRGNNFHKDDAEDLCSILARLPNLRSIDISDNPITDEGIRYLIPYFVKALEKASPLLNIKIENCNLSGMGVIELLRSLPPLKEPLNMLSLADNHLGCSVAATLAKFLGNSCVKELNLEDIELGASGFQELEELMPRETALSCINISKNRGGIRTAHLLSRLISQAPNLVAINAGANIMPPESIPIIQDALKQSKGNLERLDLTGNSQLCLSNYTSVLQEFCHHGKPIVIYPSPPVSGTPYDDDP
ncbi:uncharacterized protein [Typha latifolia]|uniref:uncharacterized protein isoform X1 n=1 Tax=Typha latifolia TaxID=4733 RepID=UPI003C2F9FE6